MSSVLFWSPLAAVALWAATRVFRFFWSLTEWEWFWAAVLFLWMSGCYGVAYG